MLPCGLFLFLALTGLNQGKSPDYSSDTFVSAPAEISESLSSPKMIPISGGSFLMGNIMNDLGPMMFQNLRLHQVIVGDYSLGAYEVTFAEYDAFCEATKRLKPDDEGWGRGQRPVINVTWYDVVQYCNWLSRQNGLKEVYAIQDSVVTADWKAKGYRLPSEAEWEYAAREGGKEVRYGNGKNIANPKEINYNGEQWTVSPIFKHCVFGENREQTIPVGTFSPNALGIHDMSGNAAEWCWDWYHEGYYENSPLERPHGPDTGETRVVRGGSWNSGAEDMLLPFRMTVTPRKSSNEVGFRLARSR